MALWDLLNDEQKEQIRQGLKCHNIFTNLHQHLKSVMQIITNKLILTNSKKYY